MDDHDLDFLLSPPSQWPEYYGYQPLDSTIKEIRVLYLSLLPQDPRIYARLTTASLTDSPRYEALSYYWGPPGEQISICIDGVDVKIRATLHTCLYNLCTIGQTLPLWIDSLCINQRDGAERNQQVSMMGEIYKTATRVKSWLGNSDADTDYVFAYIQQYNNPALLSSPELGAIVQRVRDSTLQIANRPYWTRVWIVQEIGLARELYVICGQRSVAWDELIHMIKDLHEATSWKEELSIDSMTMSNREKKTRAVLRPLLMLEELRRSLHLEPSAAPKSLLDTISQFSDHQCFDARDKAYGFRSIAKYGDRLSVDYQKPVTEIFFDVLKTDPDWWEHVPNAMFNGEIWDSAAMDMLPTLTKWRPINEHVAELEATEDTSLRSRLSFVANASSQLWHHHLEVIDGDYPQKLEFLPIPQGLSLIPGDIVCKTTKSSEKTWGSHRIILRVDTVRQERLLVGLMLSANSYQFVLLKQLVSQGEVQICKEVRYEPSTATITLFLHHSRCSLLAACMVNDVDKNGNGLVSEFRERHPLPQLCTCIIEDDSERLAAVHAVEAMSERLRSSSLSTT